MSVALLAFTLWWLQGVPARALVLAMTLSYALCFLGLLFAYLSYRRRRRAGRKDERSRRL
jgi:hypothetical protein